MTPSFLLAAAAPSTEGGNVAQEIAMRFGWNAPLFISQLISFCVVAFLLYKFAYNPILQMLDERRRRIEESMANAERIKSELATTQAKTQELLGQAGSQANKIIEEARVAAAKISEQESQKAVAAAAQIIAKAKESNDAELARMKNELRAEVTRLVVEVSAKVTGNVLTVEQKQRLADDANSQLANN
jgi:F-type H+-transporting ATPase subunit b